MTTSLEDLARRLTVLEQRMDQESGLRASQDRDLGDMAQSLRAQNMLIQALAITQSQQTEILNRHGERLDSIDGKLADLTAASSTIVAMLSQMINDGDDQSA